MNYRPLRTVRVLLPIIFSICAASGFAQTAFLDFNTVGQYTNNFNAWNDNGSGTDGGAYSFSEGATSGVNGTRGVSIFANNDTTASYKTGGWNFATNGATIIMSTMILADGQSGNRTQYGVKNVATNGINSNAGISFETFRFIPGGGGGANNWAITEQTRSANVNTTSPTLGTAAVTSGHWYKFVLGMTNTSGATGNFSASCALFDYGTSGLVPGANLITFSTLRTHTNQDIAKLSAVFPSIRSFQNSGISAFDNWLVYTPASAPTFTIPLTNTTVALGSTPTFSALAEGPGAITYAWYTNGTLATGATTTSFTAAPAAVTFTNLSVVAANANGSVTNSVVITVINPALPQVASSPASNITATSATLSGQVLSTGGVTTTVNVYYGTTDGGTNAGAWANAITLGSQTNTFSTPVTGLNSNTTYYFTVQATNSSGPAWATPSRSFTTPNIMMPIALTGFNRDVVIENTASGPPYSAYAQNFNAGEATTYYQNGLPGTSLGLPASGAFYSVIDGTLFQMQPYTGNNALVLSSDTGTNAGTLTLVTPATYNSIAIAANSGSATATSTGTLTINFADGSSYVTTYNAFDWFFNTGFAIQGLDRIGITSGTTSGSVTDPRFYQTTLNLATLLGATNKAIASFTFGQATGANATGVYAVSGLLGNQTNVFNLATVTNSAATAITTSSATLSGQVISNGGAVPDVVIHYGPSNGGTNAASWANSVDLGTQNGTFSTTVSGLTTNTSYFFTASAANAAGIAWAAPSRAFTTLSPGPSVITNLPAIAIGTTSATLQGQVVYDGGSTPLITFYYGTANAGTNAGSWQHSVAIGAQTAGYAQTITGLVASTTYFFSAQASNAFGASWASPALSFATTSTNAAASNLVAVLTYHNNSQRLGVNSNETILAPTNVNSALFGKIFSHGVDGYVFAQPLIMTNVNIVGKGTHNVVYVATEHNTLYAFDSDNATGLNANALWQVSFLNAAAGVTTVPNSAVGTSDIVPEIGMTATPVIDPVAGTIYVEVKTKEVTGGVTSYVHRLHALDITTGAERNNSPVLIAATNYPGTGAGGSDTDGTHVLWNPLKEHSRPALTLLNGVIYLAYASHGDQTPYHGWLYSYDATSLAQLGVFCSTPNGGLGGFWQGGGGATVDPQGNFYLATGNGSFNATGGTFSQANNNFAMSVMKFVPTNGVVTLTDYFSPHDESSLSGGDSDLGSGAPLVLPDSVGTVAHPHLLAMAGKGGRIYIIDRDNMGRFNSTTDAVVQEVQNATGTGGQNGSYMTPAFFNNTLYYIGMNSTLMMFPISGGLITTTATSQSGTVYGDKGSASPSISANGTNNGIVWALENDAYASTGPAILHAYNATNLTLELYNSNQNQNRDNPGGAVKFATPTVANGKVYTGAEYNLAVYGILPVLVATPIIAPTGGIFTNSVTVTLTDATTNSIIYYTTDGTTPTTSSQVYTGPFTLTNSAAVQAIGTKAGLVNSTVASASFINNSSIGTGTGLLGQYWSNHIGSFVGTPTLVRTDAVVNFNWGSTGPDPSIGSSNYTVKWTGMVQPQFNETYTLYTSTDDGVRLIVNGQTLVNAFVSESPSLWSASITLTAQQYYNIEMDYFHEGGGGAGAALLWSSPSTPQATIPSSQLYPVTNPPPGIVLNTPTNGTTLTESASITMNAAAAAQYNALAGVSFYTNGVLFATLTNTPYTVTATGLAAGSYTVTATASDTTGLSSTSAPAIVNVNTGSGAPYGLTSRGTVSPFLNMPTAITGSLPALLSQTGVFSNTPAMGAAAGLVPYGVNVPLWSDGAVKSRWLAVPNSGAPYTPNEQISFAPTGEWSFPSGTIFVKHFDLVTDYSNTNAAKRRLETRLIVRDLNGAVYGVTYKWRADNSDADLLGGSLNEAITITNADHSTWTQTWYYPSPNDCLTCHTLAANYVLGVKTRQLNGNLTYAATGQTDNQLRTLNRLGLLNPAIDDSYLTGFTTLVAGTNTGAPIADRARSYLDANCAQCHRPGGTGPTFDARYDTPLTNQNIIYATLSKGNLGYDNAYVVTPDDLWRSILYQRANTNDASVKMPPLARNLIDTNNMAILAAWINSLPGTPALAPPTMTPPGGTFTGSVNVTLTPPDTNATLYYTLDGSLPTTNSFVYGGVIHLTNSATLSANAFEANFNNSVAASALFVINPGIYFINGSDIFTNGIFQMQFSGTAGSNYVLQASTDLINWTPISTNTPLSSPFPLTDPGATNYPRRFYRVLQQ